MFLLRGCLFVFVYFFAFGFEKQVEVQSSVFDKSENGDKRGFVVISLSLVRGQLAEKKDSEMGKALLNCWIALIKLPTIELPSLEQSGIELHSIKLAAVVAHQKSSCLLSKTLEIVGLRDDKR